MNKFLLGLRRAGPLALAAIVVACGGGDSQMISVPAAVGKRVVFVADAEGSPVKLELYAADTAGTPQQVTLISRDVSVDDVITNLIVSPGGQYVGALIGAVGGCPTRFEGVNVATSRIVRTFGTRDCVPDLRFNSTGTEMAIKFTLDGSTGPVLALGAAPDASTLFTVDTSLSSLNGTVGSFHFSGDDTTIAWVEASGLHSSMTGGNGSSPHFRSADAPTEFAVTYDGSSAVYIAPGETRFRTTALAPLAPQSSAYLTAALAPGDTLGAFALSPDGARLLYVAYISGMPQLWLVPLAAPLTEQRVDAGAPLSSWLFGLVFAWNTDGTRFAWFGGGANRVYAATLAAPTTAVALSHASEQPYSDLLWSDPTTVIYDSFDGGFISVISVDATVPLVTVELSDDFNIFDSGVDAFAVCGDGTVVYRYSRFGLTGSETTTALFSTQPMVANSELRITPYYMLPPPAAGATLVCEQ